MMHANRTGLVFLFFALALAPWFTAHAEQAASGVLISRTNSTGWQLRVSGGAEGVYFSGVVESSAPLAAVRGLQLEQPDAARLATANVLSATFDAEPADTDGVSFSVPLGTELCLRDTGSTGVKFYWGTDLNNAIPVSAPVALTGADACGDASSATTGSASTESLSMTADSVSTQSTTTAALTTTRKYHKGHYIALLRGAGSHSTMQNSIKPGVRGFLKRYTWRSLEPQQGVYNLSEVASDVTFAASQGMRLIVMIEDKTFRLEKPGPGYLDTYTKRNRAGGYTIVRWNSFVVGREKALANALARFDSNQAFEGIATQESAPGFDNATLDATGYTPEKYRDALIAYLSAASASMPTSRPFWFMNFFPRNQNYIASVANAVYTKGVIMGGPDVMPEDGGLLNNVYPFYDQFDAKMPLFGQVEPSCYAQLHKTSGYPTKYWTMPELFRFARDDLHVNYMFWVRVPKPSPLDSYDWTDAIPVIGSNPTFN